ncbi:nuclear transport factor 2 family protein [Aquimarina sp. 2201CG5-10]|uniref:nuclear transport factor 2 family protein n=1 Tax=Aquimarina callyspongiae TaxID=3098150 RepID=UPI002AB56EB3|nr:nuclear transport factor 2 family protein [Aquimarina sp. 2201CG5-10]MDY8138853.1 nuclear transport factor 2 family protein [Aquimarina sp. 2201CG5-10]
MHKYFLLFLITSYSTIIGQVDTVEIQKDIDKTVWSPFQKAYEALDGEALNAIYADQVLRVTPEGIDTQNEFKRKNLERLKGSKESKTRIKLDFWFDSRHTNKDTSYEVGFYKIEITTNDKVQYIYGQFHIVLKKITGVWKITQDWDTTAINGKSITAEDFNNKKSLKF